MKSGSSTFCAAPLFRQGNVCVESCQTGYYGNTQTRVCDPCDASCSVCVVDGFCYICKPGYIKGDFGKCVVSIGCSSSQVQYNNKCFNGCPVGTRTVGGTCERSCDANTYLNSNGFCYPSCPTALRTPDACVNSCPAYTTQSGDVCLYN